MKTTYLSIAFALIMLIAFSFYLMHSAFEATPALRVFFQGFL